MRDTAWTAGNGRIQATCGVHEGSTDIPLYGQPTWDLWSLQETHGHTALWTAYTRPVDTAELPAGPGYLSPCGAAREPRLGDLTAADGEP